MGVDVDYLRELVAYWAEEFDWAGRSRRPRRGAARPASPSTGWGSTPSTSERAGPGAARAAAGPLPRLARRLLALRQGDRAAHRSAAHGGDPSRRVRRGRPGHARLRVLRQADAVTGLAGCRRPVGRAHGRSGLSAIRRRRRRHGQPCRAVPRAGAPGPGRRRAPHRRAVARTPAIPPTSPTEERAWIDGAMTWGATEGAYAAMHRTKPPDRRGGPDVAGRAGRAWIVEKLQAWSDCGGDVEWRFTKRRDPHAGHHLLVHRHHRVVHAHVPGQRGDPAGPARPPGRGAVRLRDLRRRRRAAAAGLAGPRRERGSRHRAATGWALRGVRGARALRRRAREFFRPFRNLPALPDRPASLGRPRCAPCGPGSAPLAEPGRRLAHQPDRGAARARLRSPSAACSRRQERQDRADDSAHHEPADAPAPAQAPRDGPQGLRRRGRCPAVAGVRAPVSMPGAGPRFIASISRRSFSMSSESAMPPIVPRVDSARDRLCQTASGRPTVRPGKGPPGGRRPARGFTGDQGPGDDRVGRQHPGGACRTARAGHEGGLDRAGVGACPQEIRRLGERRASTHLDVHLVGVQQVQA